MTNRRPCVLCGTECDSQLTGRFEVRFFDCPKCGTFGVTRIIEVNTRSEDEARLKAAMLASERHIRTSKPFVLSDRYSGVRDDIAWIPFEEFITRFPDAVYEMLERTLLNLAAMTFYPSDKIRVTSDDIFLFFAKDVNGMNYILRQMEEMGWISKTSEFPDEFTIEAKGWLKVGELRKKPGKSAPQAFVAMWFDESMQEIFENGIRPAVEIAGKVKCVRIDQIEHNNKICDQIIAEIRRSKFVIADFTGNRGGVYFEAGLAQGMGLPVIWLVKEDHLKDVHFDTRQYNHIVYQQPEDLYEKLSGRIAATISEI